MARRKKTARHLTNKRRIILWQEEAEQEKNFRLNQ